MCTCRSSGSCLPTRGMQDTPETLMASIIALWHDLHVPLSYRARFYLGFKGREEVFYFELEHRRLEWKRSQWLASSSHKEQDRAVRALEVRVHGCGCGCTGCACAALLWCCPCHCAAAGLGWCHPSLVPWKCTCWQTACDLYTAWRAVGAQVAGAEHEVHDD
jgi:hypothetical protein